MSLFSEIGRAYSNSMEYMFRGVCDHKNTLGAVSCVLGLGFPWRFLDHWQNKADPRRRRYLWVDGAVLAIAVWLLVTANSVTANICAVTGLVFILSCGLRGCGEDSGLYISSLSDCCSSRCIRSISTGSWLRMSAETRL